MANTCTATLTTGIIPFPRLVGFYANAGSVQMFRRRGPSNEY